MFERVMVETVVILVFAGNVMSVPLKRGPAATAIIGVTTWQTRELQHRKHAKKWRTLSDMAPAVPIWLPSATYMAFPKRQLGLKALPAPLFPPTATQTVGKLWNVVEHASQEDQDVDRMGIPAPPRDGK